MLDEFGHGVSFNMPIVKEATLKRWLAFKEKRAKRDKLLYRPYKDGGGNVDMPESWSNTRYFAHTPASERLPWHSARGRSHPTFETAEWQEGVFFFVAEKMFDEDPDYMWIGRFTDKPNDTSPTKKNWDLRGAQKGTRCAFLPAWCAGVYDRRKGKESYGRREYRYIELDQYDYSESRLNLWLQGYNKNEADLLARRSFEDQVAYMERLGEGTDYFVGVEVTAYLDAEHTEEVGSASTWGIEDDAGEYFDTVARDLAQEAASEALPRVQRQLEKYTGYLAKLEGGHA